MEIALGDFHDSFSPGEAICAAAQVEPSFVYRGGMAVVVVCRGTVITVPYMGGSG